MPNLCPLFRFPNPGLPIILNFYNFFFLFFSLSHFFFFFCNQMIIIKIVLIIFFSQIFVFLFFLRIYKIKKNKRRGKNQIIADCRVLGRIQPKLKLKLQKKRLTLFFLIIRLLRKHYNTKIGNSNWKTTLTLKGRKTAQNPKTKYN